MSKHLIVASIDAMVYEDLEYARTLPNFARIMNGASVIERVRTIYPTLTHPIHATLITGNTAGVTGVVNNSVFNSEAPDKRSGVWYNYMDEIKCDTLLHAAKRAGLTTASATWPLTSCGADVIDYLIPCALKVEFEGYENDPLSVYRRLGAQECVMDIIEEAVNRYGYVDSHPEIEEFQAYCCVEIIKRYKPNLLLTHPSFVDSMRHRTGVFGENVNYAIRETDRWLGMLLDAVREAGIENETDFVFLSDHGQINITRNISPNVYLAEAGYIKTNEQGEISEWSAYVKSADASAHVYLKNPEDKNLYDSVYKMLSDMAAEGIYGIEKVYTTEEVKEKYSFFGDFSFVIEGDGYTKFGEWLTRPSIVGCELGNYSTIRGTHGHEPNKGPQPTFVAKGPSFKEGIVIAEGDVLNHAPTLAAAMGVEIIGTAGKAVKEILA